MKYLHGSMLIYKFLKDVFPEVDRQLGRWIRKAEIITDAELSSQALASIKLKKFHAQGGSVYALYPGVNLKESVRFIVAFQTISDYLDNLCDRTGVQDETAFRQLHLAMHHAVDLQSEPENYYFFFPHYRDNGYLSALVEQCRSCIGKLPAYRHVVPYMIKYAQLYSELQIFKHLAQTAREKQVTAWARNHLAEYPQLSIWEFSAAAGSTLGVFAMYAAAQDPSLTENQAAVLDKAYFPWICALHILLDYYIDIQEDIEANDLNLAWHDSDAGRLRQRLPFFIKQAFSECKVLPFPEFHATIIRGLLAMYLSDPKASSKSIRVLSRHLLRNGGLVACVYYRICKYLRKSGKL